MKKVQIGIAFSELYIVAGLVAQSVLHTVLVMLVTDMLGHQDAH